MHKGHNGSDYIAASSTHTFTSGSFDGASRCIFINILDDRTLDVEKNFTVALFTEDPSVILRNRAVVTILDNDGVLNLL